MRKITYHGNTSEAMRCHLSQNCVIHPPKPRIITETLPYRNGALDFSKAGGQLYYDRRVLEYEFIVKPYENSVIAAYNQLSVILEWLIEGVADSGGDLYDTALDTSMGQDGSEIGHFTNATVTDIGEPEFIDDKRNYFLLKVTFECDPFWVTSDGEEKK